MSTFGYRVVRKNNQLAVHEVYFDENAEPTSCTGELSPATNTIEALRHELKAMLEALEKPIVDFDVFLKYEQADDNKRKL